MALNTFTYEFSPNRAHYDGTNQENVTCYFTFKGDSSWADNGEAFDLAQIGMSSVTNFEVQPHLISGGTIYVHFVYDRANGKLVAYEVDDSESTLADVIVEPASIDFSSITLYGWCRGAPLDHNT